MKVKIIRCLLIGFAIVLMVIQSNFATALVLEVGPSGYKYTFIQDAIDNAVNGDEVLVHKGIYKEVIDFKGKAIVIHTAKGADQTIIEGSLVEPVVKFDQSEKSGSVLDGFTIQSGSEILTDGIYCGIHTSPIIKNCIITNNKMPRGHGIYCENYSTPTISNCLISKNTAEKGAGIFCDMESSPTILNCIVSNNSSIDGSGIYCEGYSFPTITNCIIDNNEAARGAGIFCDLYSSPMVINCIVYDNKAHIDGGGIYCMSSSPTIINCTFSQNEASGKGGGIFYSNPSYCSCSPKIINSIFWGDKAGGDFNEIHIKDDPIHITYSDIMQTSGFYPGEGNINSDPLFMNSKEGNYYLKSGSQCIDSGTSHNIPEKDKAEIARPQGLRVDMGAYEYVDIVSCTPRAMFTVNKMIVDAYPGTVYFDASYSGGSQYDGAVFSWDFGDGSGGSGMKVYHIFPDTCFQCDSYDVRLTVTTECGSHSLSLTISDVPMILNVSKEAENEWVHTSIQDAIDEAKGGEIILVNDGTYFENIDFKGKDLTVRSKNGAHSTIIDGSESGSVVTFDHREGTDTVLDGFTIQNGLASKGGGIYCEDSSPVITNCNINNNTTCIEDPYWDYGGGGGIFCEDSSPTISNCSINNNTSKGTGFYSLMVNGGGIYCRNSSPTIINCFINNNSLEKGIIPYDLNYNYNGGGIYCEMNSLPKITNCTIKSNTAEDDGGGIFCMDSSMEITHCTINNNTAEDDGGGIFCWDSSMEITHCTIKSNTAEDDGGGIFCWDSSPEIAHCIISSNTSEDDGGGIYCVNSSPWFIYCNIRKNIATWWGGGIYCENHSSPIITTCTVGENTSLSGDGGGIYCFYNSSPEIVDCKIRNNTAFMDGGGIYCNNNSSPKIINCTISVNSTSVGDGSGFFFDNSSPVVLNNILWGNMSGGNFDQIFLGSNVIYSSYKFLSSGNDDRISIPIYNQRAGRWKACYRFFGKTCGEDLPIQSCDILFIFYLI